MAPVSGDDYAAQIPAQPANTLVDYWLTASSDSAGIDGALPAGAPSSVFTYRVGVDVTAPVLTHAPPPDPAASQMPVPVRVTASDNLGLDSVAVVWRKTGGPEVTQAIAVSADGRYTFPIGAGAAYGDVITYRFTAVDKAAGKNRATLPAGTQPFSMLVGGNYAETFESGDGGYTHSNLGPSFYDQWHHEYGHQHTPGGAAGWKCGSSQPFGTYRAALDAGLVTPPIVVGTGSHLKFWHDYEAEAAETPTGAYDGGLVEISTNNGSTWTQITPVGGYPRAIVASQGHPLTMGTPVYSGTSNGFVQADFDLASYAGQTVRFRWRFASDGFVEADGWYVDDVTVIGPNGQPLEVPVGRDVPFALSAPRPNPSSGAALVTYSLPVMQHVRLALYDVRGRLVRVLWDGERKPGEYAADWNGTDESGRTMPAGLYFYRLVGSASGAREGRLVRL
jgi:hypothetical protein